MTHAIAVTPMAPGVLIGSKYRLLRLVGEGAMGSVWAARNEVTSAEVAIKLLRQPDAEMRKRLQREARAGATLKHRHILDVYDAGETEGGDPFLVMQLLQGETLADMLRRRRRLDPSEAARIGRDVARALAAAHAMRIVHRDLKPANIFLHQEPGEDEPLVKVLDFGVAKDLSSSDSLRTVAGTVIGSLYYMSPEQANGDPDVDPRADLWSLGVVLFEMLTGQRPFQGEPMQVLAAILGGEIPRVSRYVRRVDEDLVELVARCMRRSRDERYGSAAEVVKLLHRFAEAELAGPAGRGSMASAPDEMTRTAPLPAPAPAVAPKRGGTIRMEDAPPAEVVAARTAAEADAAGRRSTAPVTRSVEGRAISTSPPAQEPAPGRQTHGRGSGRVLAIAAGLTLVAGLLGGGGFLVLSGRPDPTIAPVQPPSTQAPTVAPTAAETRPAADVQPTGDAKTAEAQLPAADAPATTATPSASAAEVAAPAPADSAASASAAAGASTGTSTLTGPLDPCAGKSSFLLTECRKQVARKLAGETYDEKKEGSKDNPYE